MFTKSIQITIAPASNGYIVSVTNQNATGTTPRQTQIVASDWAASATDLKTFLDSLAPLETPK